MTVMDQIAQMQAQGMNSDQVANQLRARGVSEQEIVNAMSQSQIKQAVAGGGSLDQNVLGQGLLMNTNQSNPILPNQFPGGTQAPQQFGEDSGNQFGASPQMQNDSYAGFGGRVPSPGQESYGNYSVQGGGPYGVGPTGPEGSGEYVGMQPSMLFPQGEGGDGTMEGEYGGGVETVQEQYGSEAYPMYQPYQEAMSSDVITEISEQVVNERLSVLHDKIEKILDMRTVVEANMTNLNDRLKRMEKIVDQMQVSILKKVGEYLTDIQDVKNELEETQKSFVAIHKSKKKGIKK